MLPTSTLDGILLIKTQVVETAFAQNCGIEGIELSQVNVYSSSKQLHFEIVCQHMKTNGEYRVIS